MQLALDHHTGKEVAIKFIRHGPGFESWIVARELINQRMCYAHPHIVQLQVCLIRCRSGDGCQTGAYITGLALYLLIAPPRTHTRARVPVAPCCQQGLKHHPVPAPQT